MRNTHAITLCSLAAVLSTSCYDELDHITHRDLTGTVRIPKSMVALDLEMPDGRVKELDGDIRLIGPVYIGVFPSIRYDLYDYPHPEIGPILDENSEGNTYPYGGTTVGRFDWGCYDENRCQVVTGRYRDYDDMLDWFTNVLETPLTNELGDEVTSGIEVRETCYEYQYLTGDAEVRWVGDLDFREEGDYFVADIEILHSDFREGVSVWGWVDMPVPSAFAFDTCNREEGSNIFYYTDNFQTGSNSPNVLNSPGDFISEGDLVAAEPAIVNNPDKAFTLDLGLRVE